MSCRMARAPWHPIPAVLAAALAFGLCSARAEDLPPETLTVEKLAPADENRLYISDVAFRHMVDGRLHVVDGKRMKYLGLLPTGFGGQSLLSPDKRTIYVVSTYYPRLTRGERTDVVSLYDADTLAYRSEIVIPPRHAQSLNYRGIIASSADGRFLYVQNATPATSVSIVDLKEGKLAAEVQTPGCWGIFASAASSQRFQTLCSDGAMLTVSHDANGQPAGQKRSARMFDPQADPVFLHAERIGNTLYFLSFNGNVYTADLSGETPGFGKPWPIVDAADAKGGWKPGGYQLFALHAASQRLYVGMHPKSREGSHKSPAAEIWTLDLASHKRVARAPGGNAVALTITQGPRPTLYVLDAVKSGVVALDPANRLKALARLDGVSENAVQVEAHQ
ncbi:amine dehydrogenase [Cupriavidus sp. IDO]|nr:amine dehydrogenase [Cupriavidus sp. IDO]